MAFIQGRQLHKTYHLGKTRVEALRGVDFAIERGEYVCIAGPSGAGKSTLLNLIGMLDAPTSGELYFDGQQITGKSDREVHDFRKSRVTFIFQSFNLIPVLDAYENIEFPLLIQNVGKKERRQRIERLAAAVGVETYLRHKPDELSGGQRQRVAIARALATQPALVLGDEPTANLDSVTGRKILELMREMNREQRTTFVVASHDEAVMREADRVIRVVDGVIQPADRALHVSA
ncbi:MAG: ABC transporter ATP-binding protein [Candidatus Competibacteraceae bacterium]|nr:ABC transporter ATP-binding protein [Candidatus Competibacteraceae bacterium]